MVHASRQAVGVGWGVMEQAELPKVKCCRNKNPLPGGFAEKLLTPHIQGTWAPAVLERMFQEVCDSEGTAA
jgi:hypothetical protein